MKQSFFQSFPICLKRPARCWFPNGLGCWLFSEVVLFACLLSGLAEKSY